MSRVEEIEQRWQYGAFRPSDIDYLLTRVARLETALRLIADYRGSVAKPKQMAKVARAALEEQP